LRIEEDQWSSSFGRDLVLAVISQQKVWPALMPHAVLLPTRTACPSRSAILVASVTIDLVAVAELAEVVSRPARAEPPTRRRRSRTRAVVDDEVKAADVELDREPGAGSVAEHHGEQLLRAVHSRNAA